MSGSRPPRASILPSVPEIRIRSLNRAPVRPEGELVLYWMVASRRLASSHAVDRVVEHALGLGKPILVLEPLDAGYRWASDRHHRVVLDGMKEHDEALSGGPVGYHPYVEPEPGAGRGLLAALARHAAVVVTDDSPVFFTPRLLEAASRIESCRVEAVDGCGLLPLRATDRPYTTAHHFRRHLQKTLLDHLGPPPAREALSNAAIRPFEPLPAEVAARWPRASPALLSDARALSDLPIDHSVSPTHWVGGQAAARRRLAAFVQGDLSRYGTERNDPDSGASSGLSPALHYGHISAREVFDAIAEAEGWSPARVTSRPDGRRSGWWSMSESAEAFLDELVTWRELGHGFCRHVPDYDRYESLPAWALETLEAHAADPRPYVYTLDELAAARTHDPLWNAAQRQLREEGTIHNYLRMLWGKKILEWTAHPRDALAAMIELNNRYGIDGRDPNSYSGIFWVLGRFDRGWPERPIYGKVRSMSSASTRRKVRLERYLERWG